MGEAADRTVILRWSRHPRCVSLARAELRTALAGWGFSEWEESAVLVLSELLTNAGQHARVSLGREIETLFRPLGDGVRIEVHDASDVVPQVRDPEPGACGGRGLLLVAALADRWGYGARHGPGKVVWAEFGSVKLGS
ncbi:ATP-binding protein [Streptomyces gelaticus]|uniref:ATP-binding protein n=1 Tax=Streptomyces gelaticus TaxID=285446 RepID=A0ABQ2VVD9_9ACTN|nr:ATP-binding protein [Streptomyces gelaticus]GGV80801.1 ATP-binding protein [Streptomyces gelaticus]